VDVHHVEEGGAVVKIHARLQSTAVECREHNPGALAPGGATSARQRLAERILDHGAEGAPGLGRDLLGLGYQVVRDVNRGSHA